MDKKSILSMQGDLDARRATGDVLALAEKSTIGSSPEVDEEQLAKPEAGFVAEEKKATSDISSRQQESEMQPARGGAALPAEMRPTGGSPEDLKLLKGDTDQVQAPTSGPKQTGSSNWSTSQRIVLPAQRYVKYYFRMLWAHAQTSSGGDSSAVNHCTPASGHIVRTWLACHHKWWPRAMPDSLHWTTGVTVFATYATRAFVQVQDLRSTILQHPTQSDLGHV